MDFGPGANVEKDGDEPPSRSATPSWHGTNAFLRDGGDRIFRPYFVNNRGDEAMGSTWAYLDITALGRQEQWEDSPDGYLQTPPYHDEYSDAA